MPTWLSHILSSVFLHQDQIFLHSQEKISALRKGRAIDKYHMPTPADKMVVQLRAWFEKLAGGGVFYFRETPMPEIERVRDNIFDVYHSHTEKCQICMKALKDLHTARIVAVVAAVVAVVQAAVLTSVTASANAAAFLVGGTALSGSAAAQQALFSLPPLPALLCALLSVLCVAAAVAMTKLIGMFHVYSFSHADNN
ncbi:MAG: hypothetical protein WDW36_006340 [Sanguina aurantia]